MNLVALLLFVVVEVVFSIPVVSNEDYHNPLREKDDKYLVSVVKKRQISRGSYSDIIVFPDSVDNEGHTILPDDDDQRRPGPRPVQNIHVNVPDYTGGSNGRPGGSQTIDPNGNGRIPVFEEPDGGFVLFNGSRRQPMGGNAGLSGNRRPLGGEPGRNFDGNGRLTTAGQSGFGGTGRLPIGGQVNGDFGGSRPVEGPNFDGNGRPITAGQSVASFDGTQSLNGQPTGSFGSNRRPLEGQAFDGNGRPTGFGGTGRQPLGSQPTENFGNNRRPLEGQNIDGSVPVQPGFNGDGRFPQGSSGGPGGRIPQNGGSGIPVPNITTYAAFSGGDCASGLLKFGEQCIYIDK